MYSDIKSVRILVALLKEYGIKHIVCSPGNRNVPIVHSLEQDTFFKTYSVVDERSAAFFGIGLINRFKEPVAICCTSGTAVCNYYSGITEAFYQKLPLCVISADRNPYYLNQDEEQMLPQTSGFEKITKKIVQLPMIKDESDEYTCGRLINEALLELNHHGSGPVQINIPLEAKLASFTTETLPEVQRINRYLLSDSYVNCCKLLRESRVLVLYGQSGVPSEDEKTELIKFSKLFDAPIAVDPLANINCENTIQTFLLSRSIDVAYFEDKLCHDIVITLHSGYVSYIRSHLKSCKGRVKHWCINEEGICRDAFMCISKVFEASPQDFIKKMNATASEMNYQYKANEYIGLLEPESIDLQWSDLKAVKKLVKSIPQHSKLHIANSSSIRLVSNFDLDPTIEVCCNRGVNGIDGSVSAFVGMCQEQEELCYLLVGDLSFFYDMNSLWNSYLTPNMRVILNNNQGATLFHYTVGLDKVPQLDQNIAAGHTTSAEGWVKSRGFRYFAIHNEKELDNALTFARNKDLVQPVFIEVFSDKEVDAQVLKHFYTELGDQSGMISKKAFIKKLFGR